jgi:hypothetical protein
MTKTTLTLVNYPPFFEEKLRGSKWRSAIDSSVTKVSEILQVSHLPFFSDYTDHGPQHMSKVAETSEKLLADAAREVFSAEDTAILARLLRDSEVGWPEDSTINGPNGQPPSQRCLIKSRWALRELFGIGPAQADTKVRTWSTTTRRSPASVGGLRFGCNGPREQDCA